VSVKQISVRMLADKLAAGEAVYLLDVRQPWEHELAHLPGSVLIPLDQLSDHLDEVQPPAGALVVAYCHHGVRSLSAAAILDGAGIPALSLAGGIDAWSHHIDASVARY